MQNRISHVILSLNGKNWSNSKAVMKKIMFITGSRGEWGYIRPILRLMNERDDVQYILVVTNMHLLPSYGNSYKEIEMMDSKFIIRFICLWTGTAMLHRQNL